MADGNLRQLIQHYLPGPHWQAVESGGTGRGIPDVNGCWQGVEVWVENKITSGWQVGLRPEQIGWIHRRARAGGRVFVLTRRVAEAGPRRGAAVDDLYLHAGRVVVELAQRGLQEGPAPLLHTSGGPSRWNWAMVRDWLFDD